MIQGAYNPPSQRFLQAYLRFSDKAIEIWKKEAINRCKNKEMEHLAYERFINWQPQKNEVALFTLYTYTDLQVPLPFNCIFDYHHPEIVVEAKGMITQSVWEAWYPSNTISSGHKHLCVLSFEKEIPEILNRLKLLNKQQDNDPYPPFMMKTIAAFSKPKATSLLGICQMEDYPSIFEEYKKSETRN